VDPGIADALVPNLMLQPLVENAIKHGIAARPGSGRVEIVAVRRGPDRILLAVKDDGPGPSESPRRGSGEGGVGLRNTRDRLELLYPGSHEFDFRGAPGRGCQVSLSIPLAFAPRGQARPRPEPGPRARENALPQIAVLVLAAAVGAAPAGAAPGGYTRAIERSHAMLDQVLQLYPGTAVAVAVGDEIVWSTAFGFSDVDRHRPVSRSTQFRIYEAAMPLTATVMAKLAEGGRLDLTPDQIPAGSFSDGRSVTARALAISVGRRGFRRGRQLAAPCSAGATPCGTSPTGSSFVRRRHTYVPSRRGYLLLSAALESASGRRFSDLLNDTVAGPAGMVSTMVDDPRRYLPGRSNFYERGFLGLLRAARPVDTSCLWGGGGLVSTTEDLVRFGAALLRGEILRRDSLKAMFKPQTTRDGAVTGYGLGWHVESDSRGRPYVWHGGRGVGGRAAIVIVPHARLVTVMLSNIEGERLDEHARRIAAFFLEGAEAPGGPPDLIRAFSREKPSPPFAYRAAPAPGE
jgi:CubicO group peptidase (beta-lactamase class C family)